MRKIRTVKSVPLFLSERIGSPIAQRLMGKISSWAQLAHENVLPLYGVAHGFGYFPSLVMPWVNEGSLNDYIANNHLSPRRKWDLVSTLAFSVNIVVFLISCDCVPVGQTGSSWPRISLVFFHLLWKQISLINM